MTRKSYLVLFGGFWLLFRAGFLFLARFPSLSEVDGGVDAIPAIFIHSETCNPCHLFEQTVAELEREGRLVAERVSVNKHPEIREQWAVTQLPTLLLQFPDGREERVIGNVSKEALLAHLHT